VNAQVVFRNKAKPFNVWTLMYALEWVIDQYQVSTDKRSGITNDPNRPDDPEYIVRLLGQVITVSLETVKVVRGLPPLGE
jgi:predicted helicase